MSDARFLLSIEEAAHRLSIGRSLCYGLVLGGELPSLKLGRRRLVSVAALERFIQERLDQDAGLRRTEVPQ